MFLLYMPVYVSWWHTVHVSFLYKPYYKPYKPHLLVWQHMKSHCKLFFSFWNNLISYVLFRTRILSLSIICIHETNILILIYFKDVIFGCSMQINAYLIRLRLICINKCNKKNFTYQKSDNISNQLLKINCDIVTFFLDTLFSCGS